MSNRQRWALSNTLIVLAGLALAAATLAAFVKFEVTDADRFSEAMSPCTGVMHVGRVGGYSFGSFAGQIVGQFERPRCAGRDGKVHK